MLGPVFVFFAAFSQASDPVCRLDSVNDIETILKQVHGKAALKETARQAHRPESPQITSQNYLPQSHRKVHLHGLASLPHPTKKNTKAVAAYLEIDFSDDSKSSASGRDGAQRIALIAGESYYGFYFVGVHPSGFALFRDSKGQDFQMDPGETREASFFYSFRPLATDIVLAIDKGDEQFLLDDWARYRAGQISTLGIQLSGDYNLMRRNLQIIQSSQENDFLHFITLKSVVDANHEYQSDYNMKALAVAEREVLVSRGYASWDDESQRLYISSEIVRSCAEPIQRNLAPWQKGGDSGLFREQSDVLYDDDDSTYLFRRCLTGTGQEGVCCQAENGHNTCEPKKIPPSEPAIYQSCNPRMDTYPPKDECGRINFNQAAGELDGKACKLPNDSTGRCLERECIPEGSYQDENPCLTNRSKAYQKALNEFDHEREVKQSERNELEVQVSKLILQLRELERKAPKDVNPSAIELNKTIEEMQQRIDDIFESESENSISPEEPKGEPSDRFEKVSDGQLCGLNRVCRDGQCIRYQASDWTADFSRWKTTAAALKQELIESLAEKMSGQNILVYPTCVAHDSDGSPSILRNGTTCNLRPPSLKKENTHGNCWEGQCLPCDRRSETKLKGIPPCPQVPQAAHLKGIRRSCTDPEYCLYE